MEIPAWQWVDFGSNLLQSAKYLSDMENTDGNQRLHFKFTCLSNHDPLFEKYEMVNRQRLYTYKAKGLPATSISQ